MVDQPITEERTSVLGAEFRFALGQVAGAQTATPAAARHDARAKAESNSHAAVPLAHPADIFNVYDPTSPMFTTVQLHQFTTS
jgi:hypothetical protein